MSETRVVPVEPQHAEQAGDTPMPETDIKSLLRRFITAHGSAWVADCTPHVSDTRLSKVWDNSNAHEEALSDAIDQLEASLTAERMARDGWIYVPKPLTVKMACVFEDMHYAGPQDDETYCHLIDKWQPEWDELLSAAIGSGT